MNLRKGTSLILISLEVVSLFMLGIAIGKHIANYIVEGEL